MTQMDLFTEDPVGTVGRKGKVAVSVGVAATNPKPRRKRRPKPQVPADAQPAVYHGVDNDGRDWTRIMFRAPAPMLSVNSGNQHWRRTSAIHKTFREAMFRYAQMAKLPTGLARVRIDMVLRFPRAGRQDIGNYYVHTVKPCVDGIGPPIDKMRAGKRIIAVGYGLIPDDTAQYLDGPHVVLGEPVRDKAMPFGQVVVTITDLQGKT